MTSKRHRIQLNANKPVSDWATDFDFLDPNWVDNPYPIWDALRSECSIAHTDRVYGRISSYALRGRARDCGGHGTLLIAPAHSTGWTPTCAARTTRHVRSTGTSGAKECSSAVFYGGSDRPLRTANSGHVP